ncbi:MAG: amidohydrolase family protein [Blastocatellia bacterium]
MAISPNKPPAAAGNPDLAGVRRIAEKLNDIAITIDRLGWRPLIHAGGDKALDILLTAYEAADRIASIRGQTLGRGSRAFRTGKTLSNALSNSIASWRCNLSRICITRFSFLSRRRTAAHTFPARLWLDAGVIVAGGSDYSKMPPNPFGESISSSRATQRKMGVKGVGEHAVTREQALRMYTNYAAYMTFEEDLKGSIEVGKLADLVILSDDYLTAPDKQLREMKPLATVVGGKVVYQDARYDASFPVALTR